MKSNNSFSRITLPIVLGLCVLSSAAAVAQQTGSPPAQRQGQGRRNFDPAQARQNRLDGIRAGLDIKADDEWNAIKPLVEKVMDAQRDMGGGRMRGGGQGRRGGGNTTGADTQAGGQGGGQRRFGPAPLPEAESLQAAVDNNASKDEIQSKLAKLRDALKAKETKLAAAQENLRGVLTVKQEASAVLLGLLK